MTDVVVLGGGPAGAAAAIALARSGASVLLFERNPAQVFKPGEIIEPTIRYPLAELGLLERFERLSFLSLTGNLSIWGGEDPIVGEGMLNPHGAGYLIDRGRVETWLLAEARNAGVVVVRGCRPRTERVGGWSVTWNDTTGAKKTVAPLVVDATGRSGAGLTRGGRERLDSLVALLAYLPSELGQPIDHRLFIEAVDSGWWYSAPLPNDQTVVALMTDADLLPAGAAARLQHFNSMLAKTKLTATRLSGACPTAIRAWPANTTRLRPVAGHDWAAVGDAASTYDPLTGRGVVGAMVRGVGLARAIVNSSDVSRATTAFAEAEIETFDDYLTGRRELYSRETRWQGSEFWLRRQGHS